MDSVFEKLRAEAIGHQFEPDTVLRKQLCRNPEHRGAWDEHCWKAHVTEFFNANSETAMYERSADDYAQDLVNLLDEGAMVTKYIFVAEGMDTAGQRATYASTTENLSVLDELGMAEFAKQLTIARMQGRG